MRLLQVFLCLSAIAVANPLYADLLAQDMFSGVNSGDVTLNGQNYATPEVSGFSGAWVVNAPNMRTATNFNTTAGGVGLGAGSTLGGVWDFTQNWNADRYATRSLAQSAKIDMSANGVYYLSFYSYAGSDSSATVGFSNGSLSTSSFMSVGTTYNNFKKNGDDTLITSAKSYIQQGALNTVGGPFGGQVCEYGQKSGVNLRDTQGVLYVAKIVASASGNDEIFLTSYQGTVGIESSEAAVAWIASYQFVSNDIYDNLLIGQSGPNVLQIDGIRVGTTFMDVTGVPEPATMSLLLIGGILPLMRRKK